MVEEEDKFDDLVTDCRAAPVRSVLPRVTRALDATYPFTDTFRRLLEAYTTQRTVIFCE